MGKRQVNIVPLQPQGPMILRTAANTMICVAGCVGLAAALIFAAFPEIDLTVSRAFFLDDKMFLFAKGTAGSVIRDLLRLIFALACVVALVGFVLIAFFSKRLFGLGFATWAYLLLCVIVGPGIVANLGFKDHWGRARPVQVAEFGGTKQFTPAFTRSNQCERNCSFISGEASNIFVLGFALALLTEQARRRRMLQAAIAAGAFAGLIRIGAGAHFVSDVFFAGIFMAFVARGLGWLLFERLEPQFADGGTLHRHMHWMGRRSIRTGLRGWLFAREKWRQHKRKQTPINK
jgi:lipid A 4'-phosphatase